MLDDLANQGAVSLGVLNSANSQYQGLYPGAVLANGTGMSAQQTLWGNMLANKNLVLVEVERAANGFVLKIGSERHIAKDLDELQRVFTSQIASALLEESK